MGLEAESQLTTDDGTFAVKALLESDALILRGGYKQVLPRSEIVNPHALGESLLFEQGGQAFALNLAPGQAAKWLKKLTETPPSLAAKLGVDATHKVLVRGDLSGPALAEALSGAVTTDAAEAIQGLIVAKAPEELAAGLADLTTALPYAPIWIVYPKGAKSPLPESAVRSHLRALGYVDTKASAVSAELTATRFSKRA